MAGLRQQAESSVKRGLVPGRVNNQLATSVMVWSSDSGVYAIAPASSSKVFEDVDHILVNDQWYKIGWNTVTVHPDGTVSGVECKVDGAGKPCPPHNEVVNTPPR
jgi:hypothetical protein